MASIRSHGVESKPHETPSDRWTEGLNPQQAEAVVFNHRDGAALVLAGAGSGKTTVLTRRIARLCLEAQAPTGSKETAGILALTFTKDAAHEMETRLRTLLGDRVPASEFPRIGTFHAFAFGLIRAGLPGRPNWRRLGFMRSPGLMDAGQRRAWLMGVRKEAAPEIPLERLESWLAHPFETSGTVESFAKVTAGAVPAIPVGEEDSRSRLRRLFRTHLLESGAVAFDDMVALALRLLRECPDVLADFQSRTAYVLVDEFQDTSRDQLELVRILMGGSRNLFLVGDDDQAIYGFRGADPGNIDAAMESFPGLRVLKLETNYRSTHPIVEYANSVFRDKPRRLRKRLVAGRTLKGNPVWKIIHAQGAEQAGWMADEMRRLRRAEGLGWGDIAILYRLNILEPYYRALVESLLGADAAREIIFSTVHGAKGLEYPAVFFVGLEDGILPYKRRGEPLAPERLAEEKRIFYVGVTRAQRFLYLCAARRRVLRGKTVAAEVSPFLLGRVLAAFRKLRRSHSGRRE